MCQVETSQGITYVVRWSGYDPGDIKTATRAAGNYSNQETDKAKTTIFLKALVSKA